MNYFQFLNFTNKQTKKYLRISCHNNLEKIFHLSFMLDICKIDSLYFDSSLINFKTSFGNCVYKALCNRKWKEVQKQSTDFTLQWCEKQRVNDVFETGLSGQQRVNHFRLYTQLCRKDMLMKNVRKHKRLLVKQKKLVQKDWSFLPLTFFLPSQYIMFSQQFKKQGGIWIMKPTARCQGSGIFLVDKLAQVAPYRFKKPIGSNENQNTKPTQNNRLTVQQKNKLVKQNISKNQNDQQKSQEQQSQEEQAKQQAKQNQTYIIQQYIDKPLLFGRKKFDLRIYVLCTNYSQLTVWLYRQGFARFTHQPYTPQNIMNLQSHLTNVQIQKHSQNYDQVRGGKWLIDRFKHYLMSKYGVKRADQCFQQMMNIIIRSLEAVQKHIIVSKNSFQLYGYDLMIDSNLKPWLIEVNGGPSMTANTEFDCKLKCGLIDDVLTIVNLEGLITGEQMTVGAFDLIVNKGVNVRQSQYSYTQTNLGWKNNRIANYKHLLKQFLLRKRNQKLQKQSKQQNIINKQNAMSNLRQQKQNVKNMLPQEMNKKQKLLPDFYYKKRPIQQIDECVKNFLKKQLGHLNHKNQNLVSFQLGEQHSNLSQQQYQMFYRKQYQINYARFVPLKANKLIRVQDN